MTPCCEKRNSLPFLPATPLSPFQTCGGFFELSQCPSRNLNLPFALLPELQKTKAGHQVCCAMREGPRTLSKTSDADLDCAFEENALVFVDPNSRGTQSP